MSEPRSFRDVVGALPGGPVLFKDAAGNPDPAGPTLFVDLAKFSLPWQEDKHPRDQSGRFAATAGIAAGLGAVGVLAGAAALVAFRRGRLLQSLSKERNLLHYGLARAKADHEGAEKLLTEALGAETKASEQAVTAAEAVKAHARKITTARQTLEATEQQLSAADLQVATTKVHLERKAAEMEATAKDLDAAKVTHGVDHDITTALDEKSSLLAEEHAAADAAHKAAETGQKRLTELAEKHRGALKELKEGRKSVKESVGTFAAAQQEAAMKRLALEERKAAAEARIAEHETRIASGQAEFNAINQDRLARAGRTIHAFGEQFRSRDPLKTVPEKIRAELKGIVEGSIARAPGEERRLAGTAVANYDRAYQARLGEVGHEVAHREAIAAARKTVGEAAEKLSPDNADRLIAAIEIDANNLKAAETGSFSIRDWGRKTWDQVMWLSGFKGAGARQTFDETVPPTIRRYATMAVAAAAVGLEGYHIASSSEPANTYLQVTAPDKKSGQSRNVVLITSDRDGRGSISTDPNARAPQRGDRFNHGSGRKVEGDLEKLKNHVRDARQRGDLKTPEGRNKVIASLSFNQVPEPSKRRELLLSASENNTHELPSDFSAGSVRSWLQARKNSGVYGKDQFARDADRNKIAAIENKNDRGSTFAWFDSLFKGDGGGQRDLGPLPDRMSDFDQADATSWQYDELFKEISHRINTGTIDEHANRLSVDVVTDSTLEKNHKVQLLQDIDFHDNHPENRFRVKEALRDRLERNAEIDAYTDDSVFDADLYRIDNYPHLKHHDRATLRERAYELHNQITGASDEGYDKSEPSAPLGAGALLFDDVLAKQAPGPLLFKDAAFQEDRHPRDEQGRWATAAAVGAGLAAGAAAGYGAWRLLSGRSARVAAAGAKIVEESEPAALAAAKPPPEAIQAAVETPAATTPGITPKPRRGKKGIAVGTNLQREKFKASIAAQITAFKKTGGSDPTRATGVLDTLFNGMHHLIDETKEGGEVLGQTAYIRSIVQRVDFGTFNGVVKPARAKEKLKSIIDANRVAYRANPNLVDIDRGRVRFYPALTDAERNAYDKQIQELAGIAPKEKPHEIVTSRSGYHLTSPAAQPAPAADDMVWRGGKRVPRPPTAKADAGAQLFKAFWQDRAAAFRDVWNEALHPRDTRGRFEDESEPDEVASERLAHRHAIKAGRRGTRPYNKVHHDIRMDTDEAYRALHSQVIEEHRGSRVGPAIGVGVAGGTGAAAGLATGYGLVRASPRVGQYLGVPAGIIGGGALGAAAGVANGLIVQRGWMHQRLLRGAGHGLYGLAAGAVGGAKYGRNHPKTGAALLGGVGGFIVGAPPGERIGSAAGVAWDTARTTRSVDKADGPVLFGELAKDWTEARHPRAAAGDPHAGQFVPAKGTLENAGGIIGGSAGFIAGDSLAGRALERLQDFRGAGVARFAGKLGAGLLASGVGSYLGGAAGSVADRAAGTQGVGPEKPQGTYETIGRTLGSLGTAGIGLAGGSIGLSAAQAARNPYLAIAAAAAGAGAASYAADTVGGAIGAYADETPEHRHAVAAGTVAGVAGLALWRRRQIMQSLRQHYNTARGAITQGLAMARSMRGAKAGA